MTDRAVRQRLAALRRRVERATAEGAPQAIDAVLVTEEKNRAYLSGFTGSAGALLITQQAACLLTDFRYVEQAAGQAPDFEVVKIAGRPWPSVAEQAARLGLTALGFEAGDLTVEAYTELTAAVRERCPGVQLVPLRDFVEGLRQVKDSGEVELIRRAVELGDRAFESVIAGLTSGVTERELAWRLEVAMREGGADGLSFPIIVASGPHGAMPHHRPSERPIGLGEPVVIDMGCRLQGYCSDMTRTITLGEPDSRFWEIYDLVLRAQQACAAGLKAGLTGQQGDALARDVIARAGHGEHFGHGTGHGVGLAIHENPRLTYTELGQAPVPLGAVVTVEPGVYLPGWGGVRIEDMVVVGEQRCQILTTAHKHPVVNAAHTP
ncbi:MAG TPA: aminopeptidase P family protein [Chloroflexota bacterium]|nr:aminopeptidase P family protein [Chloroflexota bacterium]